MNHSTELLKTLTLDQIAELTMNMKDWVKDCQWGEGYEDEDIDAMTDHELITGINRHYSGGMEQFIKDSVLA